jgi:hypothetical protein
VWGTLVDLYWTRFSESGIVGEGTNICNRFVTLYVSIGSSSLAQGIAKSVLQVVCTVLTFFCFHMYCCCLLSPRFLAGLVMTTCTCICVLVLLLYSILMLDSQYTSLVPVSTPNFILAHSVKFVRLSVMSLTTCCLT